jgi:ethanolamine utilization protein EutP (predicted NTPase)
LGRHKTRTQRGEGPDSGHPSATHPTLPQDDRPGRYRAYSRHEYRHGIPVAAADSSFDAARLEPMLAMAHESGARPVVLLNKIDLCADLDARLADATRVAGDALVLAACALTGRGVKQLSELIKPGDTAVFIGTSGVGKSSLINRLYGEDIQATVEVRTNDAKGRHTTSWREMIFLPVHGEFVMERPLSGDPAPLPPNPIPSKLLVCEKRDSIADAPAGRTGHSPGNWRNPGRSR